MWQPRKSWRKSPDHQSKVRVTTQNTMTKRCAARQEKEHWKLGGRLRCRWKGMWDGCETIGEWCQGGSQLKDGGALPMAAEMALTQFMASAMRF